MIFACRLFCGIVFLASGVEKAIRFPRFHAAILRYAQMPTKLVPWFGIVVFLLEIATGLGILLQWHVQFAAAVGLLLLVMFTIAIGRALSTGKAGLACGCSVLGSDSPLSLLLIGRNILLGGMLLMCSAPRHALAIAVIALPLAGTMALLHLSSRRGALKFFKQAGARQAPCAGCGPPGGQPNPDASAPKAGLTGLLFQ